MSQDNAVYSDTPGLDLPENQVLIEDIKYFFKETLGQDVFYLPDWFVEARKKFTRDELQELYDQVLLENQ